MASRNPAKRKKGGKRSSKGLVILAVVVVLLIAAVFGAYKIFGPTHNMEDLEKYFFLTENSVTGTSQAGPDEYAIVMEDEMLDQYTTRGETAETQARYLSRAYKKDGAVYLGLDLIYYNIDERFYWNENEKTLLVTNALDKVRAGLDETGYYFNGEKIASGQPVVIEVGSTVYVDSRFVDSYSDVSIKVLENPRRVYISKTGVDKEFCEAKSKTPLRIRGGIKSNVVVDIEKGEKLQVISDEDDWLEVINEQGFLGYIRTGKVGNRHTEMVESDYDEPEYTSMNTGQTIKLGWHGVYNKSDNDELDNITVFEQGMNVISPTWYSINYSDGTVGIQSDADYVSKAHSKGYLVWALLDIDPRTEGESFYQLTGRVMGSSAAREKIISTVMADMAEKGIDGINVDIETVNSDGNRDYIQFLRELSIECRKAKKYLTVDNYTPYANNANIYHIEEQGRICDYVVIMGYDDYVGTGEVGPNASVPFVEKSAKITESILDMKKVIYAFPFYTRIWYREGENGQPTREEYGINDALEIAASHGDLTWDEETGYNSIIYQNYNTNVYIWLEDEHSLEAKFKALSQYDLAGVAFWKLGQERPAMWDAISNYY